MKKLPPSPRIRSLQGDEATSRQGTTNKCTSIRAYVGNSADNFPAGGGFASIAHDQEFHDAVIDLFCSRLNDIDIFSSDGLLNLDDRLPVGLVIDGAAAQTNIQMPVVTKKTEIRL